MSLRVFFRYLNLHSQLKYSDLMDAYSKVDSFMLFTCDFELTPLLFRGLSLEDAEKEIEAGLEWLLSLLNDKDVRATFFVEGFLCKLFPHLVVKIGEAGHEIGCHGYVHASYGGIWFPLQHVIPRNLPVSERRVHIRRASKLIEETVGDRPRSFRAPFLALDEKTIKILSDEGFLSDSSLYNLAYGKLSLPYHPNIFDLTLEGDEAIYEVPITVSPLTKRKWLIFQTHVPLLDLDISKIRKTAFLLQMISSSHGLPTIIVPLMHLSEYFIYEEGQVRMIQENIMRLIQFLEYVERIGMKSVTMSDMIEIFAREYAAV